MLGCDLSHFPHSYHILMDIFCDCLNKIAASAYTLADFLIIIKVKDKTVKGIGETILFLKSSIFFQFFLFLAFLTAPQAK